MANITNKETGFAEWRVLAAKELKRHGVKNIPSDVAFYHAWEFGETAIVWALWVSEAEIKKDSRKHNRPAGPSSNSNGMQV